MPILTPVEPSIRGDSANHPDFIYWCPGCDGHHAVWVTHNNSQNAIWKFNLDLSSPTFVPSVLIKYPGGRICHHHITNGRLIYLPDSTHKFAGQSVVMVDMDKL